MTGKDNLEARLIPARPAAEADAAGFRPKLPWRWVAVGVAVVSALATGYVVREHRELEALRAQLLDVRERGLAEPVRRYTALRATLEGLILKAATQTPASWADPQLRLEGLHAGKGLYLRIPASEASSAEAIARAALKTASDSLASCLGIAPVPARALWDKGAFLSTAWAEQVRKQRDLLGLRVTDTMLARSMKTDLPQIAPLLDSAWFLLVLDRAEPGRDGTLDAFLWDLRGPRPLLSGRVLGEGKLLPVRIATKDAPQQAPKPPPLAPADAIARDCSAATQLRDLAPKSAP